VVARRADLGTDVSAPAAAIPTVLQPCGRARAQAATRSAYTRFVKPVFDRALSLVLLLILLPAFVGLAVAVRLLLGPRVIYRQRRVGHHGAEFEMLKFRTMLPDRRRRQDPAYHGPERRRSHKRADDPRHTPLGRRLRRTGLDELPQLWNVVRGQMSLVGPRPELVEVVERYNLRDHPRHSVKPGITGLWQVSRSRCALLHEGVDVDLEYLHHINLCTDLKILVRTPVTVVRPTGA
jgi:lipopolysaccharide/colanic/teichoic acid biosynthesis glycosyltransferase